MKKTLLLISMLLTSMLTTAQLKQVAVLETVDREGKLSYSQKLLLRSNMERAISNTPGYEAFDRSNVDMIMSEHDFQRTGLVSSDQIRKLGEMTGVSLILVIEGVLINNNQLFVTAKVLNVETARVEIMDNIYMDLSAMAIENGCHQLAKHMFGTIAGSTAVNKYDITRKGSNEYLYTGKIMDKHEYNIFLKNNCPAAFRYYNQGKVLSITGWVFFAVSPALIAAGSSTLDLQNAAIPISLLCVGCIGLTCVSIPLLSVGYVKQHKSVKVYNQRCSKNPITPLSLNIKADNNGLGLALQF